MSARTFARWNKLAGLDSRYRSRVLMNEGLDMGQRKDLDKSEFIAKISERSEVIKKDDGKRFPENFEAESKMAEYFLSIAKSAAEENKFENGGDGTEWMLENAIDLIEEKLKNVKINDDSIFMYAAAGVVLQDVLDFD